jgi:hypothetical protein
MPRPSHSSWFDHHNNIWCSSPLCSLVKIPATSSHLGLNSLFSTLFSNALSLCSSLSVRDQLAHPYKTTGKIVCILIIKLLERSCEDKRLNRMSVSIPGI